MNKKWIKQLSLLILISSLSACGGTAIQTNSPSPDSNVPQSNGSGNQSTAASFANAAVQSNFFNLGSDFPPSITIPDIPGMTGTAFIVTFTPPAVIPVDLATGQVSSNFPLFDASTLTQAAFPNQLFVASLERAYLLSSTHVVIFNPSTGQFLGSLDLTQTVHLSNALPYSVPGDCDFNGSDESSVGPGPFNPSFPADLAVIGQRLFVTMSNACFDASFESFYVQGLLLSFDILPTPPYLTPSAKPYLALPGFNVTALSVHEDRLFATSTGDTSLQGATNIPQSDSFITEVNPQSFSIVNLLNLGPVAANFQSLAIDPEQNWAFVGSAAYSEIYQIDLGNFQILRGEDNPIVVSGGSEDFISDQALAWGGQILFAASFNNSAVYGIALNEGQIEVLPGLLDFSFSGNPGVTGAGPMALRPGQPGADFTGPDLWVLTSNPGSLSHALTY